MTWEETLKALASQCGIALGYWNIQGKYVQVPQETIVACLEAMGFNDLSLEGLRRSLEEERRKRNRSAFLVHVLRKPRKKLHVPPDVGEGEALVRDEKGRVLASFRFSSPTLEIALPEDTQWGYYTLTLIPKRAPEMSSLLIFSPCEAYLENDRIWGVHGALFALATKRSQGIGDLKDLEMVQNILLKFGGKFLGLLPLHLMAKEAPERISPYLPLSRMLFDPIYLPLEEVLALFPGVSLPIPRVEGEDLIDYEEVWNTKNAFLRKVFQVFWKQKKEGFASLWLEFQEFVEREQSWLFPASLYQVIALQEGPDWREWST
ncbi:MAG: 4-alpha-glucanotransferase, partial [Candidatus Caldatribacterium sp.]|nr:4-alpha-glucanotransferase [Candidatus Caldatribacterium sp.]